MAEESSKPQDRDEHASDEGTDSPGGENGNGAGENGNGAEGKSGRHREKAGITAPSIGPNTVIERVPPEERLAGHEHSQQDAMGRDKRRSVVGERHAPTFARQAALYGIFLAVVVVLAIGAKLLVDKADQPPKTNPAVAPWAQPDAPQHPPKPLQ
jgi:hypothetical protein